MMKTSVKHLWAVFHLKPVPSPWRRLWGTGLTTSLGLVLGLALGHLEWGIWMFMGGFASLYVQDQPYRVRAIVLALVGLGLTSAMGLGSFSLVWWHLALALGFVSAAATYAAGAFDIPLPAGFMFILIACISAALPHHPAGVVWHRMLGVLAGAAIAWLIGMSDVLWDPTGPTTRVVAHTFRALAQYAEAMNGPGSRAAESRAAMAVMKAHRASQAVFNPRLELMTNETGHVFRALVALSTTERARLAREWVDLLKAVADRVRKPGGPSLELPKNAGHDRRWQRFREVMEHAVDVAEDRRPTHANIAIYRPTAFERLRRGLSRDALVLPAVMRIGMAILFSVAIAHFFGIPHAFWVPLTCAAVLQGISTAIIAQRTIQRAVGTTVGLILAGALIAEHPAALTTAALVVLLQLLMLFFIAKNYGISVIFITSLALIIIYSGTHASVVPLVWARFRDTLLGGAIGLTAAFGLWGRASSARLPGAMSRALNVTGRLMHGTLTRSSAVPRLRSQTLTALLTMRHLYEVAIGEMPAMPKDEAWPLLLSIERLGYLVVSLCDNHDVRDPSLAEKLDPVFDTFAARLDGQTVSPMNRVPSIPQFPAIEEQLWELAQALEILAPEEALL